jgi:hypothetical protein
MKKGDGGGGVVLSMVARRPCVVSQYIFYAFLRDKK